MQGVFAPKTFAEYGLPGGWNGAVEWQYPPHQRQGAYEEEGRAVNTLKVSAALILDSFWLVICMDHLAIQAFRGVSQTCLGIMSRMPFVNLMAITDDPIYFPPHISPCAQEPAFQEWQVVR